MTRLWIFSDLHYEMGNSNPPAAPEHDVCIVPGDLNQLYWAIDQLRSGEMGNGTTIYVPGNHDYYRQDCMEAAERMAKQSVKLTKVFLANPGEYCFGGIRFLGCTLWSDYALYGNAEKAMRDAARGMMDHRLIKTADNGDGYHHFEQPPETSYDVHTGKRSAPNKRDPAPAVHFMPEHALKRHKRELAWLEERLKEPFLGPTVICSHHSPSPKSIPSRFDGDPLSPAFSSNLEWLVERYQPALWIHGHTHDSFDYHIGKTRILCNPAGYQHEPNPEFRWDLVIDLDEHKPTATLRM
jgi:predicted phosphodiesterase